MTENAQKDAPSRPDPAAAEKARRMRALAVSLLLTTALFSGVVMGVMIVTRLAEPAVPPETPTLLTLRAALAQDSSNEILKAALREEDQQARQNFFAHRRRLTTGAYLLLAGLAATVICARWYVSLERKTPRPTAPAEREDADRWLAGRRRNIIAVAVVSVTVLAGLLIFGLAGGPPIPTAPFAGQATPQAVAPSIATTPAESAFKENWPRFRGPDGGGLVKADDWPQKWDAATGENIVWKTPVPMPGNSSPVLWGDRLFLTGANADTQKAFCFSRASGKLLWQTPIFAARGEVKAEDIRPLPVTGYASPTPATDGVRLYVTFASADIAAVDGDGRVLWARNLGKPEDAADSSYGRATSLLVYKDKVIVQFDRGLEPGEGLSAMLALDARTGRPVWSAPRPVRRCWCTPILITVAGRAELVANGSPWIIAYDPDNGRELWRCSGMKEDVAASPAFADGLVYVTNDHAKVFAIRPTAAQGDVTATNIVWTAEEGLSDTPSPVCDGRFFLQANSSGLLTCFDAKSGKLFWSEMLDGRVWASPTLAGDRVCVPSEDGNVYLFDLAEKFGPVTACKLGEPLLATPAFADGRIYFRGDKTLFCVGAAGSQP